MRLLLQFAMVFFGTLMAAGLLALGAPHPKAAREQFTRARHHPTVVVDSSSVRASLRLAPIR